MARVGNGSYVFIPDSSFVGTGFVNGVANVLTTVGQVRAARAAASWCGFVVRRSHDRRR